MTAKPIALVTGATSGIGEATAYRLQARGYLVFAVGRNADALDALRSRGLQARALDVTDEAAVERLVEEIHADHGVVDVLVNSAGFSLSGPLEQVALNDLRSLFETNVVAMLHLSQAVLPAMRAAGRGTIVNIGSTIGRFTTAGSGAYSMSKYSVQAMSLALRAEVARFGVRVTLIDPTGVRTRLVERELAATHSYADDDPYREFKHRYAAATRALAEAPFMMISADTVAKAVLKAIEARSPKPRYVVGASGKASVLARSILTDRMWERAVMMGMNR